MNSIDNRPTIKAGHHLCDPDMEVMLKEINLDDYRDGSRALQYGTGMCPFGEYFVAFTPDGVSGICFTDGNTEEIIRDFRVNKGYAWMTRDDELATSMANAVMGLEKFKKNIRVCVSGTPFQLEVWSALMDIPFGETVSYSELARRMGKPKAVRAVASAVAKNDVAYVIPCHRVVRSDGSVGQYRWGAERKARLLEWEKKLKDEQNAK